MCVTEEAVSNTLPIGSSLHWYEVQDILGRGGYGITYLAFDKNLHRKVAIKEYLPSDFARRVNDYTVHPLTDGDEELYTWGLERFLSEARTLAKFNHKAIIKVNSVFEQNNTAYMVMEYEEGDDLAVVYEKHKPFTQDQLLQLFLPIVEGLAMVHDAGFIHRDIKPNNIYVRHDGSPVLLDFGSARQTLKNQTNALTTLVTTGYAPFEQYNQSDDEQGVWTDIYALGCTLYYCITGDKPVDALKRSASLIKHGRDVYEPISNVNIPGFSQNFLRAIDHALMFHPERRPHSARYWANMLTGKVGVAAVTDDLFRMNHPDDTYYDLDSTVVMAPVTEVPFDEQTIVQAPAQTGGASSENQSHQPNLDQTLVQTSAEVQPQDYESQAYHQPPSSPPIQVANAQQLDQIAEALARPAEQPPNPVQQQSTSAGRTRKQPFSESLRQFMAALSEKLSVGIEAIKARLPKQAPIQLNQIQHYFRNFNQNLYQNKTALAAAASVVLVLAVVILILGISGESNTEQKNIATLNETINTSEENTLIETSTRSTADATLDSEPLLDNIGQVAELLQQAQIDQAQGRLVDAAEEGAYYQYRKILEIEPQHQIAIQEIQNIEQHFAALVTENIQNNDWQQAQTNFANYKLVSDNQTQIAEFQTQFAKRDDQLKNIDKLLAQAEQLFSKNRLTKPESRNALALYNEVLALEPNNGAAKDGVNNIIEKLGDYLHKQLNIVQVKSAELTYKKISEINPHAPVLADTEPVLAKLLAQHNEIIKLMRQAKADFIRGNIISPKDNNALDKYRSVIDIDPNHAEAKQGIETIYQYYLSDFNRYIDEKRFDRADTILSKMTNAKFDRKRIVKLKQRLEQERLADNNSY
jgi:serine/threonine protein kinase